MSTVGVGRAALVSDSSQRPLIQAPAGFTSSRIGNNGAGSRTGGAGSDFCPAGLRNGGESRAEAASSCRTAPAGAVAAAAGCEDRREENGTTSDSDLQQP